MDTTYYIGIAIAIVCVLVFVGCSKRVPVRDSDAIAKAVTTIDLAASTVAEEVKFLRDGGMISNERADTILAYCADVDKAIDSARAILSGDLTVEEKRAEIGKLLLAVHVPEDLSEKVAGPGLSGIRVAVESIRLMIALWSTGE